MGKVQSLLVLLSLIAGAAAQEDQGINPVVEQVSCPELPQETVDEIAQSCAEANEEEICGTECALQASIAIIARVRARLPRVPLARLSGNKDANDGVYVAA